MVPNPEDSGPLVVPRISQIGLLRETIGVIDDAKDTGNRRNSAASHWRPPLMYDWAKNDLDGRTPGVRALRRDTPEPPACAICAGGRLASALSSSTLAPRPRSSGRSTTPTEDVHEKSRAGGCQRGLRSFVDQPISQPQSRPRGRSAFGRKKSCAGAGSLGRRGSPLQHDVREHERRRGGGHLEDRERRRARRGGGPCRRLREPIDEVVAGSLARSRFALLRLLVRIEDSPVNGTSATVFRPMSDS